MKKNDTVEYIGCSEEQVKWGNNDDPRSFLIIGKEYIICLLYTSPSPRDKRQSRMPSSA